MLFCSITSTSIFPLLTETGNFHACSRLVLRGPGGEGSGRGVRRGASPIPKICLSSEAGNARIFSKMVFGTLCGTPAEATLMPQGGARFVRPSVFLLTIWGRRRLGYNVGVEYLSAPTRRCSSTSGIALLFLLSLGPLPGLCCCASACPCRLDAACLTFVVSSCRFLFGTWPPRAGLATF